MDNKVDFLGLIKKYKYYASVEHICNKCWNEAVVQKWSELFANLVEKDIKKCIASHILLFRWYQLKITIDEASTKYAKRTNNLPSIEIIERDKLFFCISNLCYALHQHIEQIYRIFNFSNDNFKNELVRFKKTYFFRLRQSMQHSLLESYFYVLNNCEDLYIIKEPCGNDAFEGHINDLFGNNGNKKQAEVLSVEEMMQSDYNIISNIVSNVFDQIKMNLTMIPQSDLRYDHRVLTSTVQKITDTIGGPETGG